MNDIDDGGPAFPSVESGEEWSDMKCEYVMRTYAAGGMSLRDYFAAKALPLAWAVEQAAPTSLRMEPSYAGAAMRAYYMADAMLKAREAK
jgi:hypothetical protein